MIALQTIFQVRHTLSHNHGVVTVSDRSKLSILGMSAKVKEVIDPSKDNLRESIVRLLQEEAIEFTEWILEKTAIYLSKQCRDRGLELEIKVKNRLGNLLGESVHLCELTWV